MEGLELVCFKLISAAGTARSLYIEAIRLAKEGKFDEAKARIDEGQGVFLEGHKAHAELIQQEAAGEENKISVDILLVHAEDQMMSAESFGILAEEFISVYQKIYEN